MFTVTVNVVPAIAVLIGPESPRALPAVSPGAAVWPGSTICRRSVVVAITIMEGEVSVESEIAEPLVVAARTFQPVVVFARWNDMLNVIEAFGFSVAGVTACE